MANADPKTGYAPVNGLETYYEVHGKGDPVVVLHGAYMTIDAMGPILPGLAETRQVIAVEQQGHGRTADIDRPITYEQMADDTAGLLRHLGMGRADVFGFSMGAGIALQLAIRHPELVRKLADSAATYSNDGLYPEVLAGLESAFTPEAFAGSPIEAEYAKIAPNPDDFPTLVGKVQGLTRDFAGWPREAVQGIAAPRFIIIGDADIVRPEYAVAMFRLYGGGVPGDFVAMPAAQLAILPGTSHIMIITRTAWLHSMITAFLDNPG